MEGGAGLRGHQHRVSILAFAAACGLLYPPSPLRRGRSSNRSSSAARLASVVYSPVLSYCCHPRMTFLISKSLQYVVEFGASERPNEGPGCLVGMKGVCATNHLCEENAPRARGRPVAVTSYPPVFVLLCVLCACVCAWCCGVCCAYRPNSIASLRLLQGLLEVS